MRVSVVDQLEVVDRRVTADGYLAVRANIARSGVYQYARSEIGMKDGDPNELVGVYRSPEYTFDEASLASFAHRPVTINHPKSGVSAKTWKRDAIGHSGGAVWQSDDKKHVVVDMLLMDQDGIEAATSTHKQISAGYSTDIRFERGISPEGETYEAIMDGGYRADHIACVPLGRAGHTCKIGDAAWPIEDSTPPKKEVIVKSILIDGIPYNTDNADGIEAAVKKMADKMLADANALAAAQKTLTDAEAKAATDLVAEAAKVTALDAEVATLKQALEDAKQTPEQMRDAAKAFAAVIDAAGKIVPAFKIEDSMSEADIRKGAVLAKLGDAYATKTQAFFDAAFEIEADKVKDDKAPVVDALRQTFTNPVDVKNLGDAKAAAATARQEMIDRMVNPAKADAK